jgi:hypothetical protein
MIESVVVERELKYLSHAFSRGKVLLLRDVRAPKSFAEAHSPVIDLLDSSQYLQERRFARAVIADQRETLVLVDRQGKLGEEGMLAESFGDLLRAYNWDRSHALQDSKGA